MREQFLAVLPEDMIVAVIERQPKNSEEAGKFAGNYLQARSMVNGRERKALAPTTKCPKCGVHEHWAHDCPKPRESEGRTRGSDQQTTGEQQQPPATTSRNPRLQNRDITTVKCYNCNEKGHYSSSCPKRSLYCGQPEGGADRARRCGVVNRVGVLYGHPY